MAVDFEQSAGGECAYAVGYVGYVARVMWCEGSDVEAFLGFDDVEEFFEFAVEFLGIERSRRGRRTTDVAFSALACPGFAKVTKHTAHPARVVFENEVFHFVEPPFHGIAPVGIDRSWKLDFG